MAKRNRLSSQKRPSSDALELSRLAIGIAESGGKLEKKCWEQQANELVEKLFHEAEEECLSASLDRLFDSHAEAHDALADIIEAVAESCTMTHNGIEYDVMLFNVPLLAWSRFSIPAGNISVENTRVFEKLLLTHVFTPETNIILANYLFSPDQLPRSFVETWQLMIKLGSAALNKIPIELDPSALPETNQFLSDTRYLLGVAILPKEKALFRWMTEEGITRESALKEWVRHANPCFEPLLTGCAFQLLLADAYHAACRLADIASRPYSLRASIAFLQTSLGAQAESLRAIVGGFYDKKLEEYRISFGPRDTDTVFHGVTWPLFGMEDESSDTASEIESILLECGIKEIIVHSQQFPFEFCDDCGAPLYPNTEGDSVHAELPEQDGLSSQTLH